MPRTEHEEPIRNDSLPPPRRHFINRPRLRNFDYLGRHVYHLVAVTRNRESLLTGEPARDLIGILDEIAQASRFELLAFTVMPDHVHVLAGGTHHGSNVIRFMQRFKQRTSYAHVRLSGKRLWQPSFYDHAVRRTEDIAAIAQYIIDNPARAGLVGPDQTWPHQGGTMLSAAGAGRS